MSQKLVKDAEGKLIWVDANVATAYDPPVGGRGHEKLLFNFGRPRISLAMGVPRQLVERENEEFKKAGIRGAEYNQSGALEYNSFAARNAVMKHLGGGFDQNGYGGLTG